MPPEKETPQPLDSMLKYSVTLSSLSEVLSHICMELPVLQLLPVAPHPVTEHLQRAQPHPLDFHTLEAYKQ